MGSARLLSLALLASATGSSLASAGTWGTLWGADGTQIFGTDTGDFAAHYTAALYGGSIVGDAYNRPVAQSGSAIVSLSPGYGQGQFQARRGESNAIAQGGDFGIFESDIFPYGTPITVKVHYQVRYSFSAVWSENTDASMWVFGQLWTNAGSTSSGYSWSNGSSNSNKTPPVTLETNVGNGMSLNWDLRLYASAAQLDSRNNTLAVSSATARIVLQLPPGVRFVSSSGVYYPNLSIR